MIRPACAALLLLLGLAAVPAKAATPHVVTVRGSRGAYVDVRFATRFRLHLGAGPTSPRVATQGTYGGAFLTRVGNGVQGGGALLLENIPGWAHMPLVFGPREWLPAGTYRVHLVTDGLTVVRFTVDGLRRDLVLAPTRRAAVESTLVRRQAAGADVPADRTVLPVTLRKAALSLFVSAQEGISPVYDQRICVRLQGDEPRVPCAADSESKGDGWTTVGPGNYTWALLALAFPPGELPAGKAEAEFVDVTVGVPAGMYAFALTIS